MPNLSPADQLDEAIERLLQGFDCPELGPELHDVLNVAAELRTLPDPEFRLRLKTDLAETAENTAATPSSAQRAWSRARASQAGALPTLFGERGEAYPVQRGSFVASLLAHAAALSLLVTAGIFAAHQTEETPRVNSLIVTDLNAYRLAVAPDRAGGGGGGGDHDKVQASQGSPPRFARDQTTPPAIVVRNESPRLPAEATVVGPPDLTAAKAPLGDPFSAITGPASNGTGSNSGIGDGSYGGVGPGRGPGVGPGEGGGFGGGPYRAGHGGVTAPRAVYDPEPEYSDEARRAKYQGTVVLRIVVGADGRPRDIRVAQSLGMGLDEKAVTAVNQWRFEPGRLDGRPVPVLVDVLVNFRLY